MFSKRSLARAVIFSLVICLYYLIASILLPLDPPSEAQGAVANRTFSTTFGAASDVAREEMRIKVSSECNYLTGRETFPVYCLEPWEQVFIAGKKVEVYYNLVELVDCENCQGENIALIRVWRQAITIECALKNKSDCSNVFAFTLWSANLVSSR